MAALTDFAETQIVNWIADGSGTQPTRPFYVALVTVMGTDNQAGTEVSGGGYARQQATFGTTSTDTIANTNLLRFDNLPGVTVVGVDIYDSSATPQRWFYGQLAVARSLTPGDPFEFPAGSLRLRSA